MAWIEGIGDELVVVVVLLLALLVCVAAWMSTYVNDPPEIADHVSSTGVVSQNLDFPGSIEDDLERIANEIEEEAEAVENEISVLTLQRTQFLQTLANPGDSRNPEDDEDDDEEEFEEDDEIITNDDVDNAMTEAVSETLPSENETIPTFEFPCPHDDPRIDVALPSSFRPSSSSGHILSSSLPNAISSIPSFRDSRVSPPPPPAPPSTAVAKDSPCEETVPLSTSAVLAGTQVATSVSIADSSSSPASSPTFRPLADASVAETSLRRRAVAEATRQISGAAGDATAGAAEVGATPNAVTGGNAAVGNAARLSFSSVAVTEVASDGSAERVTAEATSGANDPHVAGERPVLVGSSQAERTRGILTGHSPGDGHMTVRIKFINDVIREMRVKSTDTIRDFKATFFAEELAALNRVRLIYNGQLLADHLSFGHYNISHNTVIHCLVSRAGNGANGAGGAADGVDGGIGHRGVGDDVIIQELDLSRLVFPLVAVILSCVWYFRVQYRQFFNATSSVALLFLTGVFFFFVFTSLRNRRAVVVVGTPANNNNNDNGVNNNNDIPAADHQNRQNGVPA